jgi:hypothetical protein
MEIRHKELLPDLDQPFLHCKLDRQKYAGVLTTIIQNYSEGFVLALNGEWGTGKTTFVKMWQTSLEKANYKTIYFNAWENDFEDEPLIALLGELKKLVDNKNETYKSLLKKGVVITKNILPALAKGVISKYMDAGITLDVLEKSIEAATEILDKEVDEYVNKKEGLIDFKKQLETYIEANNAGKPIVFIIDELDRCRPDYAVEVLEKVKHFFSVKGIVFVLSIDKIQLGHSIQGYYGSHNINTEEYLRRFIDIEYKLPDPDAKSFCRYLFDYYEFKDYFLSPERSKYSELRDDGSTFISFTTKLFENQKYTLRQQEKLFAQARLIIRSFASNNYIFPTLFFILIHIKNFELEFYNDIKNKKLTIQELVDKFESVFSVEYLESQDEEHIRLFCNGEAFLIMFYNNYHRNVYSARKELVIIDGEKKELTFKTKTAGQLDENKLLLFLNHFNRFQFNDIKIDYLINKIDLLDNIS